MPEKPEHRWGTADGERRTPGRRQPASAAGAHRWGIAILIGAAIAISYFDRQTLPVAINAIEREIPISNTQFSQLQAAFRNVNVGAQHASIDFDTSGELYGRMRLGLLSTQ